MILPKNKMSEEDIKLNFITPAIIAKGWQDKITMEQAVRFTDGKINLKGNLISRKSTEDQEKYDNSIYGIEKKQFPYMLCITNMLLHGIDVPKIYHDNSLTKKVLDYGEDDKFDVILMNPPYGGNEKADIKSNFPSDLASSETADLFMSVIMYRLKKNGRAAVILPDGFLFGTDNAKVAIKKKLLSEFIGMGSRLRSGYMLTVS